MDRRGDSSSVAGIRHVPEKGNSLCNAKRSKTMRKMAVAILVSAGAVSFTALLASGLVLGFKMILPMAVVFHLVAVLYALCFLAGFFFIKGLLWIGIRKSKKVFDENDRQFFYWTLFIFWMCFCLASWVINHFIFDYRFNWTSFLGNLGILLFTIFLLLTTFEWKKGRRLFFYSSIPLLAISVVSLFLSLFTNEKANPNKRPSHELLTSLPYARWVSEEKTPIKLGVVQYDPGRSCPGLNIYSSRSSEATYLMDMKGKILHTWSVQKSFKRAYEWVHAALCRNGDLLLIATNKMIVRADWDSKIKWINRFPFHHDLDILENNDICSLSHNYEVISQSFLPLAVGNEYIVLLSPDGMIKKMISLHKIFKNKIPKDDLKRLVEWHLSPRQFVRRIGRAIFPPRDVFGELTDLFHTNTVEVIRKDLNSILKRGNILICSQRLDLVGIVDPVAEKLVWSWGRGELEGPHHPVLLENGNLLIYDNGIRRGYSRILELNPATQDLVWKYQAAPPDRFFSLWGGANQRLPNGNTLITESDRGRVFEITPSGEIVWEFFIPEFQKKDKRRPTIYRMMRITNTKDYPCLNNLEEQSK